MTWTHTPLNSLSELVSKPLMMAMLSSVFLSSLWGEVLTTRFEFKPTLTSYTVLCNYTSKSDFKWLTSLCKSEDHPEVADSH